ncbi:hypothetical protein [uncultured Thomasclavelia sp.]|uniref:hypothetical protein n=1 Tax=uncultured Thomasclavelia sp. TaxID=3025759 RepID=UPI0025CD9C9D|nr:hypothetical protein [uncultured Thomasclavelia sp.]
MKNFLIDMCLVALLIFMINGIFGNYGVQKEVFDQSITQFEQTIQDNETIDSDYGIVTDQPENTLSLVIKSISDFCIKIIETVVLIISNLISSLF